MTKPNSIIGSMYTVTGIVFVIIMIVIAIKTNIFMKDVNLAAKKLGVDTKIELTQESKYKENVVIIRDYIKQRNESIPIEVCIIIAEKIITLCEREKLPNDLIVAMIETESSWNPTVTSTKGAKGLMQILEEEGIKIEYSKSYDIEYNIKIGIDILKSKLKKANGNLSKALRMYVGGQKTYNEKVYQAIGMFVMYKSNILIEDKDVKEEVKEKR